MAKKKETEVKSGDGADSVLSQLDRDTGNAQDYRAQPWSDQTQPGR